MARFFGTLTGKAKTLAHREGTARSGCEAHVRGWEAGVRVSAFVNEGGFDGFQIYATTGTNGRGKDRLLGSVEQGETGDTRFCLSDWGIQALGAQARIAVTHDETGSLTLAALGEG